MEAGEVLDSVVGRNGALEEKARVHLQVAHGRVHALALQQQIRPGTAATTATGHVLDEIDNVVQPTGRQAKLRHAQSRECRGMRVCTYAGVGDTARHGRGMGMAAVPAARAGGRRG
jgi:hypothetical protein